MDPFVDQLAELCRAQVTRAEWVFVPTRSLAPTLTDRIALRSGATALADHCVDLRFLDSEHARPSAPAYTDRQL
jgi:hypothetical protein